MLVEHVELRLASTSPNSAVLEASALRAEAALARLRLVEQPPPAGDARAQ